MFERPRGGKRVALIHLHFRNIDLNNDNEEFYALAVSAGAEVIAVLSGSKETPDAEYFIGRGKVEELSELVAREKIDIALFNHELSPAQERNLERKIKCRVLNRRGLILDIFASRARTFEGKLQVELAQLQHLSTRLVGGWTHLERQKGGIGLRGPGETQLESDRRLIKERIKHVKERLEKVGLQRAQGRRARKRALLPTVSLVGYTNAGKSTLFNCLTHAGVWEADQLFATLDPTLRRVEVPGFGQMILADTVGFIQHLPPALVAAFRATLDETREADLLLHVVDIQNENWRGRLVQVEEVLSEIGADHVPRLEVYNKIDGLPEVAPHLERDEAGIIQKVWISAAGKMGLDLLYQAIAERLGFDRIKGTLCLPLEAAKVRALLYDAKVVEREAIDEEGKWQLEVALTPVLWERLLKKMPQLKEYWTKTPKK